MPTYRGPKSVLIQPAGEPFAIAYPAYDPATREYVVTLTDEQAAKHGDALIAEGMRQEPAPEGAEPARRRASKRAAADES